MLTILTTVILLVAMESPETVAGVFALLGGGVIAWLLNDRKELKEELKVAHAEVARLNKEASATAEALKAIERAILSSGKTVD